MWVDGVVREVVSYDIKGTSMRLFTSSIKNSNVGLQTACGAAQPTDLQRSATGSDNDLRVLEFECG
jgi:hypothetical protein